MNRAPHWRRSLPRVLLAGACLAPLAACVTVPPPLYQWDTFPRLQYESLQQNGSPPLKQIGDMEAQIERARSTGTALPPGFRAHLGMLKLSSGDAAQARELWLAEKGAFPESAPYMDPLLKRLEGPGKSASKDLAPAPPKKGTPP